MTVYYRALAQTDRFRPAHARMIAGGWTWFDRLEMRKRGGAARIIDIGDAPAEVVERIAAPRAEVAGLATDRPRLMGILNVTPDSFSDGGLFCDPAAAQAQAGALIKQGADILDIGGESTRPGADFVPPEQEIERTAPVIAALARGGSVPVSIDTRKAAVARAALDAGAGILNDVSALTFDPEMAGVAAASGAPICLMHAQGDPKTMQANPTYDDVLLDVYDFLAERIAAAEAAGIARERVIVDPGIGFGKTAAHNLALISGLSLFHSLGCPILFGASRKRFIGTIGQAPDARARLPGSVAVALSALAQGVQIIRVHDMAETRQAVALAMAISEG